MEKPKKILIVGAGIAGMAFAKSVQSQNHEVKIIEKSSDWHLSSTGLYIPFNGLKALFQLGIGDEILQNGAIAKFRKIYDNSYVPLMNLPLEAVWENANPSIGISRKKLHDILKSNLKIAEKTQFNTTLTKLTQLDNQIEAVFSTGQSEIFDLVVGADGLHSQTRDLTLGKIPHRSVSPMVCRFITNLPENVSDWTLFIGKAGQFLILPINDNEAYCYVNRNDGCMDRDNYMKAFKTFPKPVIQILKTWQAQTSHWDEVFELNPIPQMGKGPIVLIGDSVHAMPPFMAQGASLALEDALVLSKLINDNNNWANMATLLSNARRDRIEWVRSRNRKREKLSKMPFWLSKLGLRWIGAKTWTADDHPLKETPNW